MAKQINQWFRRGDWFIISGVLILAGGLSAFLFSLSQTQTKYCIIQQNNVIIETIPLGKQIHKTISVGGDYHNQIEIDNDRVRFLSSDCPNHFCEQTGWISEPYQSAVCLPNQVIIQISSENEESPVDIVT